MAFPYSFHLSAKSHAVNTSGKVAQVSKHNLREYKSDEYDRSQIEILRGSDTSILDDVKRIYHDEFDEALERYNEGKRSDRKIDDYLKHVSDSKSDVACEFIIQVGDKDFWEDKTMSEKKQMTYIFQDQLRSLEKLVPELKIASAVVHYDESSPHMHVVGVPVADGYKKGLEKQVSKTKVFTADRLSYLQDKMRENAERGMRLEANRNLFEGMELKEKEQGRNKDIPKESLNEFYRLEKDKAHLTENALAYRDGGWYFDYDRLDGYRIPKGGIEKALTDKREEAGRIIEDAETEAERITGMADERASTIIGNAKVQADGIMADANQQFKEMTDRIEGYEAAQKAQIDSEVEKYAQDQRNALEGKLEGLRGKLEEQSQAINQNNDILQQQADQYSKNEGYIKEQGEKIADIDNTISKKSGRVQELDGQIEAKAQELEQKARSISALDKVGSKIRDNGAEIYTAQIPDGLFSKRDVTVVEGYSPKELERVFQRAGLNQSAQKTVEQAQKDAQGIISKAQEQGQALLAQNQATIDRANDMIAKERERRAKLDRYEQTVKEENAKLTADNAKLRNEYRAYTQGWTDREGNRHKSLNELREDIGQARAELSGLQDQESEVMEHLKDLSAEVDRKTAFVDAELSPDTLKRMMNDSMITNLVQDTMHQTCLQLEERGLLQSGAMAFLKLDKKPILERFKEQVPDFVQKVKDHMQEIAERVIHHSRHR